MANTRQTRTGNVTGAGHGNVLNRIGVGIPVAHIPTHRVLPRQLRRLLRQGKRQNGNIQWPKWVMMSDLQYAIFRRAGLIVTE